MKLLLQYCTFCLAPSVVCSTMNHNNNMSRVTVASQYGEQRDNGCFDLASDDDDDWDVGTEGQL